MNDTPKISVIIPVYNQEKYLRTCIESVLSQSIREIEVICVNDGSTDGSFSILSGLSWTDDRIRIINQDNKGAGEARNAGIMEAKGEFLAFIDPDDWYYDTDALETLYNKAKVNGASICGGCFTMHYEGRGEKNVFIGSMERYVFNEDRYYTYKEYQHDYGFHRFIYERKYIIENNLFFPSFRRFQDPVWFVNVLHNAGRFYGVSDKVYSYRSGHKEVVYDKEKVLHVITAITEVEKVAAENEYEHLLELEKTRLIRDFAEYIYPFICNKDSDIIEQIHILEKVTGFKDIENEILANIISKRDSQLTSLIEETEEFHKNTEKYRMENGLFKRMIDEEQMELKQINENMAEVLKKLDIQKKELSKKEGENILPYPYVDSSHEKDGIKWTDLGDGRIEADGTAIKDTFFYLTPSAGKTNFKTHNRRYLVSVGAPGVSVFSWFISGRIAENKEKKTQWRFLKDVTINDTDSFAGTFEIDTSGYDYFGMLFIYVKRGSTLDHVIFDPKICPIE